ncbi:MAG TPA: ferritin family protein [Azospirillum sp.]|nr:ferritin family protein [Azospirillum sp.]
MKKLFESEPFTALSSVEELLGMALAMEEEAVRRYRQLANIMESRCSTDTAATFLALAEEEQDHAYAIAALAARLGRPLPQGGAYTWRLPPEIAASWDDLTDRTRVTPYRALAVAVLNEQRGFAWFSYVSANTADPELRRQAEALAAEELTHAALLRRERRIAFRRERAATPAETPADVAELEALLAPRLSAAAARHTALSAALFAAGDAESAALLTRIATEEGGGPPSPAAPPSARADLLRAALAPCAELSEFLSDIAARAIDEPVFLEAQRRQEQAVAHMQAIAERLRTTASRGG